MEALIEAVVVLVVMTGMIVALVTAAAWKIKKIRARRKRDKMAKALKYSPFDELVEAMEKVKLLEKKSSGWRQEEKSSHELAYHPFKLFSFQVLAEIIGSLVYQNILSVQEVIRMVDGEFEIYLHEKRGVRKAEKFFWHAGQRHLGVNAELRDTLITFLTERNQERKESKRKKIVRDGLKTVAPREKSILDEVK
ncbi:MAG: hypothetical protein Q7T49_00290 [bacterium]|nr:hypothetical protein [bacterium]